MLYQQELEVALDVVKNASRLCSKVKKTLNGVESIQRPDRSPVTIADFGSQAVINLGIIRSFPGDRVVREESTGGATRNKSDIVE